MKWFSTQRRSSSATRNGAGPDPEPLLIKIGPLSGTINDNGDLTSINASLMTSSNGLVKNGATIEEKTHSTKTKSELDQTKNNFESLPPLHLPQNSHQHHSLVITKASHSKTERTNGQVPGKSHYFTNSRSGS